MPSNLQNKLVSLEQQIAILKQQHIADLEKELADKEAKLKDILANRSKNLYKAGIFLHLVDKPEALAKEISALKKEIAKEKGENEEKKEESFGDQLGEMVTDGLQKVGKFFKGDGKEHRQKVTQEMKEKYGYHSKGF